MSGAGDGAGGDRGRRLGARLRSLAGAALAAAVLGTGAATIAGFLGGRWWAFDLAAHFRVQYALALGVASAGLVGLARERATRIWAAAAAALLLVNLGAVAPLYVGGNGDGGGSGGPTLTVVFLNLDLEHPEPERVVSYLRDVAPDVVLLMELTARWQEALDEALRPYPHRVTAIRESPFGLGLFSRRPLVDADVVTPGEGMPTVVAAVTLDGRDLTFVGAHPFPPIREGGTRIRDRQLIAVGELAGSIEGPVLVIGDLNTTPFSSVWPRLMEASGLPDPDRGAGVGATWPAGLPAILRLPLDHALPSPEIRVVRRVIGPDVGSDHRPVEVEVSLR